jgi:endonuclease/exonuclease/phosphatase (EEP) superfamily protein YafD
MRTSRYLLLPMVVLPLVCGRGPTAQPAPKRAAVSEITQLRQEVAQLRTELSQLRAEVQSLSRVVAQQSAKATVRPTNATANKATAGAKDCWCTTSSNKRHNSSCRYYMNSNGRKCSKSEGIPCKLCGG